MVAVGPGKPWEVPGGQAAWPPRKITGTSLRDSRTRQFTLTPPLPAHLVLGPASPAPARAPASTRARARAPACCTPCSAPSISSAPHRACCNTAPPVRIQKHRPSISHHLSPSTQPWKTHPHIRPRAPKHSAPHSYSASRRLTLALQLLSCSTQSVSGKQLTAPQLSRPAGVLVRAARACVPL